MGQALYRTHRPKKLSEVIGQEHITATLAHALKQGAISHAYLFTGPRGTGKTSVARILAHEVNNLAYGDDSAHLDIIEIDAASNRRIDEIRELRERVHVTPTSAKYKVYIIDEVHMLTREAFNALLKTLEEPPAHVIFILATTEAHKLPETIISRTQRFSFRPISPEQVTAHLHEIAKAEKIKVDDAALRLIAEFGEGSFRDSISLLDQARNQTDSVSEQSVAHLLGIPPSSATTALIQALAAEDRASLVITLGELREQGFEAAALAKQLARQLREQLLTGNGSVLPKVTLHILRDLLSVPAASDSSVWLELILLSAIVGNDQGQATAPSIPRPEPLQAAEASATSRPAGEQPPQPKTTPATPAITAGSLPLDASTWPQILTAVQKSHNTLYGILRMATPSFSADELKLSFSFGFHQKRLGEAKNQQLLATIIEELTGQKVAITALRVEPGTTTAAEPSKSQKIDDPIHTISNIFGGAELLE